MDSFNCKSCMQSNFPSKTKNVKYIVGFIFWIILFIIIRVVDKLPARHTEVFEADVTYSHSGAGSTVPISLAYVLSYVIPCIITMVLVFVFRKNNKVDGVVEVLYATFESYTVSEIFIKVLKVLTGRPRPSFFDLCGYPKNEETGLYGVYGQAIDLSKCQNQGSISYAFSSFPSGHSSVAMNGCLLYILIFIYVIYPMLPVSLNYTVKKAISLLWCGILLFTALYIGASRFFDYKHFISDIFAGFIIGAMAAIYTVYSVYIQTDAVDLKKKNDNDLESGVVEMEC